MFRPVVLLGHRLVSWKIFKFTSDIWQGKDNHCQSDWQSEKCLNAFRLEIFFSKFGKKILSPPVMWSMETNWCQAISEFKFISIHFRYCQKPTHIITEALYVTLTTGRRCHRRGFVCCVRRSFSAVCWEGTAGRDRGTDWRTGYWDYPSSCPAAPYISALR